jgi:hypothetical protein
MDRADARRAEAAAAAASAVPLPGVVLLPGVSPGTLASFGGLSQDPGTSDAYIIYQVGPRLHKDRPAAAAPGRRWRVVYVRMAT